MVSRQTRWLLAVSSFMLLSVVATPVAAESTTKDPKAEFERGVALFKAEEYALAYDHLTAAYELSGRRASTILALAQCERMLKKWNDAITHYREYLATGVSAEETVRVNETIGVIEELKSRAEAEQAKKTEAVQPNLPAAPALATDAAPELVQTQPPEEEDSVLSSPWLWIAAGAAVIGGGVALGFALSGEAEPYKGNSGVFLQP